MKLLKVLSKVNQIEKIAFLKILDKYSEELRDKTPKIDRILSESDNVLKKADNSNIVELFYLLRAEYLDHLDCGIRYSDYQLDLVVEIFTRDGNQMMSRDWFQKLYKQSISNLKKQTKVMQTQMNSDKSSLSLERRRDYTIFQNCVKTAYTNDIQQNRDQKITWEEKTILETLAKGLGLSNEEERAVMYSVIKPEAYNIDDIINELKEIGVLFYNRKTNTIFVPDEIIYELRKLLNIELPFKYLRRILKHLRDPEINQVCRKHNISMKLSRGDKINEILHQGVNVTSLLCDDIYQEKVSKLDRAKRIQDLIIKDLDLTLPKMGRSLEERVHILLDYLRNQEKDDTASLSKDGMSKLLSLLVEFKPDLNNIVKAEFELQDDDVMSFEVLTDYGIGPRDLLYLIPRTELVKFCKENNINSRGNQVLNIINSFRNMRDLYLDNYVEIGRRDLNYLKEKGLDIKEAELGSLYEDMTKEIFGGLGMKVDETLKGKINTARAKMDVLLNLGGQDVIIVECKTVKDKDYDKYAAVSRQLKSYESLCNKNGYNVNQVLLVSNEFSEDFISECEYDYELDISLLTSSDLLQIHEGFKECAMKEFPVRLITKGGALNGERIVKALNR